jgi:hypothetical protein
MVMRKEKTGVAVSIFINDRDGSFYIERIILGLFFFDLPRARKSEELVLW